MTLKEYLCRTAVKLGESDVIDVGYRQLDVLRLAKRNDTEPLDRSSAKREEVKETG